ncbi:hypothetical protein ACFL35_16435 [Candidatus Riflebacteria bacterium]
MRDPFFGERLIYQPVEMDEETLKAVSAITGGKYYNARNVKELERIYAEIDKLEKTEKKIKKYMIYKEYYAFFLYLGLLLLFITCVIENFWWNILPLAT